MTTTVFPASADPALVMSATYELDAADRRYIDGQIRQIQATLLSSLLTEKGASYFTLASGSLAAGDFFCQGGDATNPRRVVKATAVNLTYGRSVIGVALEAVTGTNKFLGATSGIVGATVTGLGAVAGQVTLNTTTARAQLGGSGPALGTADAQGTLNLWRQQGGSPLDLAPPQTVTGPAGASNVDTTLLSVPSTPTGNARALLTTLAIRLETALVGAGSVALTVGTSAGGTHFLLYVPIRQTLQAGVQGSNQR